MLMGYSRVEHFSDRTRIQFEYNYVFNIKVIKKCDANYKLINACGAMFREHTDLPTLRDHIRDFLEKVLIGGGV